MKHLNVASPNVRAHFLACVQYSDYMLPVSSHSDSVAVLLDPLCTLLSLLRVEFASVELSCYFSRVTGSCRGENFISQCFPVVQMTLNLVEIRCLGGGGWN